MTPFDYAAWTGSSFLQNTKCTRLVLSNVMASHHEMFARFQRLQYSK